MKKIIIALSFIVTTIAITIATAFSFNTSQITQLLSDSSNVGYEVAENVSIYKTSNVDDDTFISNCMKYIIATGDTEVDITYNYESISETSSGFKYNITILVDNSNMELETTITVTNCDFNYDVAYVFYNDKLVLLSHYIPNATIIDVLTDGLDILMGDIKYELDEINDCFLDTDMTEYTNYYYISGLYICKQEVMIDVSNIFKETNYITIDYMVDGALYYSVDEETDSIPTQPADPTKDGYKFVGWNVDGQLYNFYYPFREDTVLEAVFEEYTPPTYIDTTELSNGYQVLNEIYYTEHYSLERVLKVVVDSMLLYDKTRVFIYDDTIKTTVTLKDGVITYTAIKDNVTLVEETVNVYLIENSNLPFIALTNEAFHFTYIITDVSNTGITMDEVFKVYDGLNTNAIYQNSMFASNLVNEPKNSEIQTSLLLNECLYSTTVIFKVDYLNVETQYGTVNIINQNKLKSIATNYEGIITGEIIKDESYVDTTESLEGLNLVTHIYYTSNYTVEEVINIASLYMILENGKPLTNFLDYDLSINVDTKGYLTVTLSKDGIVISTVLTVIYEIINTNLEFISVYSTDLHYYNVIIETQNNGYTADDIYQAYTSLFTYIQFDYLDFNLQDLTNETTISKTSNYLWNTSTYTFTMNLIILDNFDIVPYATVEFPSIYSQFEEKSLNFIEKKSLSTEADGNTDNFIDDLKDKIENNTILKTILTSFSVVITILLCFGIFKIIKKVICFFIK